LTRGYPLQRREPEGVPGIQRGIFAIIPNICYRCSRLVFWGCVLATNQWGPL